MFVQLRRPAKPITALGSAKIRSLTLRNLLLHLLVDVNEIYNKFARLMNM
jgi:hypothetical protein